MLSINKRWPTQVSGFSYVIKLYNLLDSFPVIWREQMIVETNFYVFTELRWPVFTYSDLELLRLISEKESYVYKPTYGPPGLITFVLRLRDSSSAWVILSRVIWYESFVAHTVILSCINPRQLSWEAPELSSKTVALLEMTVILHNTGKQNGMGTILESSSPRSWQF